LIEFKKMGNESRETSFRIVGIGASAGGLNAFEAFLSAMPKDFGIALVFIQHLSSKHRSLLPDLLFKKMPHLQVTEIDDGMRIEPNAVYLCPPGKEVRIRRGFFHAALGPEGHTHYAIDEFFESLAEEAQEQAVAVVLSGAGTDGARGVHAVRTAGGCVFVQDPDTAEFPAMPRAAIATGEVDGIFPPEGIAQELLKLAKADETSAGPDAPLNQEEYATFYRLIQEKTGHRFVHYKKNVINRRIRRRMYLSGIMSVKDYLNLVAARDAEASALAYDLMIGVTSFFRDRVAWKALKLEVVRKLVAEETGEPLRVWVPACSTGEESYTVAMMLLHELAQQDRNREVLVFATDVNDAAIERAREGKYPASIAADLPPEFLQKYFKVSGDGQSVVVVKAVRERVVFARQDLLTDPPFSKLDLVTCRNLLIYLEPEAQDKCISLFHYALKPGGFLFLGNAESAGKNLQLFVATGHKKCRIYRKTEAKPAARLQATIPFAAERAQVAGETRSTTTARQQTFIGLVQDALIDEYAPAAVAIDRGYDIMYHTGPTNRYLKQPRGAPTQNFLELLPDALANRIRSALYRAGSEARPVSIRATLPGDDNRKRQVTLRITRLQEDLSLIVFREKTGPRPPGDDVLPDDATAADEAAVRQLESELATTRSDLRTNIEQLKSMNEELQSSNEELQAANEELETSREELQSLNEELITVNTQLQEKIEEQELTNNDLNNFFTSTNIPTVFLDMKFRVKRFTPAISRLIKLIPADIGRAITDIAHDNLGPGLIADAQAVLEKLTPVRTEISNRDTWYVRATLPYRTSDSRIEGVVITYNDVTELKRVEEQTRRLASFPQLNPNPVIEVDASCKVTFINPGTQKVLEDLGMGTKDATVFLPADFDNIFRDWDKKKESNFYREVTVKDRVFGETVYLTPQFNVARIYAFDITERKKMEADLRESEERVRKKLDSILSPEGDLGALDLADIIDAGAIQSLMEDFGRFSHIPMAILDLKGDVLVGVGWQEICTKFHRVHPEACKNCIESDTQLSVEVPPGEFRLYKCKNNMWDVVTPIMVGGQHVGNLFTGQFFFDDEPLDREFFLAQARQYGFDEKEYMDALEKVSRLSRESLDSAMGYFMKFADTISKLSYSNIKLAKSLAQRDSLMQSLRQSEERLNRAQEISHLGSWELDLVNNVLTWSDEVYRIFGLEPQEFGATYEAFLEAVHPDDRAAVDAAYSGSLREGRDIYEIEHRVVRKASGEVRTVHEKCEHFRDEAGRIIRSVGMVHDITERKLVEEEIKRRVEELNAANEELSRFNRAMEGRELRMIELKKEINGLCGQAGLPPRYRLDFEKEQP